MSTDDRYIVDVNHHAVEPGCWVDGHWGQYGPDHLADRATEVRWEPETWADDPRQIRDIIDTIETWGYPRDGTDMRSEAVGIIAALWELHIESADGIQTWLNDHTYTDGYSWGWYDGEFYLWPNDEWEQLP